VDRANLLDQVRNRRLPWDVIVIGGGASGLGSAVESASRGYSTLLLERGDFAQGTSSRSTKLIHGGVRYLRQGNLSLVVEGLRERGRLLANAPHLVHNLAFVMPSYEWWEGPFYGAGLKVYDLLAGKLGLGPSRNLSREEVLERLPTLEAEGLRGGVVYHDGQFDDARLAVTLALTLHDLGGVPLNHIAVVGLLKRHGLVTGVVARDQETGEELPLEARVVLNATGVFADAVRRLDEDDVVGIVTASQGVHIVIGADFLRSESAILVPHTEDGRVLFAVPWQGKVLVGTTDTPMPKPDTEPRPLASEVEFLLRHAAHILHRAPAAADIRSCWAGQRPLLRAPRGGTTSELPREHALFVSRSGLLTVAGGKWTTYRQMAEDAIDQAALLAGLDERRSVTAELRLHGAPDPGVHTRSPYGTDEAGVEKLATEAGLGDPLHPAFSYRPAEVVWAVRHEMARRLDDVLARRTRALFLDARASLAMAPRVAELMASELGRDASWQAAEVRDYEELAARYVVT
jgi:glycerol-3-phosphate dehydrogenase